MKNKKYVVTEKHPVYKAGLIFIARDGEFDLLLNEKNPNTIWETISTEMLINHAKDGWIEEIEEPELTKSEAMQYAKYCEDNLKRVFGINKDNSFAVSPHYNSWIKEHKK